MTLQKKKKTHNKTRQNNNKKKPTKKSLVDICRMAQISKEIRLGKKKKKKPTSNIETFSLCQSEPKVFLRSPNNYDILKFW